MEDISQESQEFLVDNSSINMRLLENKTGETTAGDILDINLLDSHSKYDNDNLLSAGTTALIKFDTLPSMESYIRSVHYQTFSYDFVLSSAICKTSLCCQFQQCH